MNKDRYDHCEPGHVMTGCSQIGHCVCDDITLNKESTAFIDAYICDVCGMPPYNREKLLYCATGNGYYHKKCPPKVKSMSDQNCCICGKPTTQWVLEDNKYYHTECYKLMKVLSEKRIIEANHLQQLWKQRDQLSRTIGRMENLFSEEELDVLMNMENL